MEKDREIQGPRGTDIRVGGHQVLLGLQDVGAALQQRRRQVGGYLWRDQLVDGLAAWNRAGVATEQDGDEIFHGGDAPARMPESRPGPAGACEVICMTSVLATTPALKRRSNMRARCAEVVGGGLGDFQLPVERAQARYSWLATAGHHGQHHTALRLLAGVDLRLRRFAQATDAAEQVELPGRAERALVQRKVGIGARRQWRLADPAGACPARVRAVTQSAGTAANGSPSARR